MEFIQFSFTKSDISVLTEEQMLSHIAKSIASDYELTGDIEVTKNETTLSVYVKVGVQRKMKGNQYLLSKEGLK